MECCRVGKRTNDLLTLLPAVERQVRSETGITVGIPPVSEQDIGHSVYGIHDIPHFLSCSPAVCTLLSFKGGVTFSDLRSSNFRAKVLFPADVRAVCCV
jgi:hypothetical protein